MMIEKNRERITQIVNDEKSVLKFLETVPYEDIDFLMRLNNYSSLFLLCKGIESLVSECEVTNA